MPKKTTRPLEVGDPNDIYEGWVYAIILHYKQSKSFSKNPKEYQDVLEYEQTLADAQSTLQTEAAKLQARNQVWMKQTSKNRFYGSDGEEMYELSVVALQDKTPYQAILFPIRQLTSLV